MPNERPRAVHLRLGTRGSALARWQTDHVATMLKAAWPDIQVSVEIMRTRGDNVLDTPLPLIGGKGLFTAELEAALREREIDLAVHSLKDLPTEMPDGLALGAIPPRADASDVLISRSGHTLDSLAPGATVGTSSRRRAAQLLHRYRHLKIADIRGNVDTRIRKALDPDGPYDAIMLANAGVTRLGHGDLVAQTLPLDLMLPAPGQGALAVQCRAERSIRDLLAAIDDAASRAAVEAERTFLHGLGGGCSVPIAAYARYDKGRLYVHGRVTSVDGSHQIDVHTDGLPEDAADMGTELARMALDEGAAQILKETV